ncbi:M15 family metallopeptidase [Cytobacillus sp. FSL K6-0129]|uniref:M15 family metallopeptidase n=1 Tax=Cytobacillus sp. FSL K6-0129 TaxID=2921421 RepID=UPI0030F4F32C
MTLYYLERNLNNIAKLADNTKALALKWHEYLVKNDINILIYETIRTEAKQREYVNSGASQTMRSYHLVGQALDFVPVNSKGKTLWNGYGAADVKKAIKEAKRLGFEWGGDWRSFIDKPHLQYNHKGYGTDTFNGSKVDTPTKGEGTKPANIATSIVDYLKSKGINSSFSNREKIAQQHGIKNYKGTPEQNTLLLKKLQNGEKPTKQSKPNPKGDMKTTSVVDYLKSINIDSSMTNRKKLAAKYGIKNYRGTGAQNTQLLKKLRS